ncbi:MAG: hypothetical protein DI551_11895, partial [Micavibrio aeruginosavorus]
GFGNIAPQASQPWTMVKTVQAEKSVEAREITLKAGQSMTFDAHDTGVCFFTVMAGTAAVTMNGTVHTVATFGNMHVPEKTDYSIANSGTEDLKMIEVRKLVAEGITFENAPALPGRTKKVA